MRWTLRAIALFLVTCATISGSARAADGVADLTSPDGRIRVAFRFTGAGNPGYSISFSGRPLLVDGALRLVLRESGDLLEGASLEQSQTNSTDESYRVPSGKSNPVRNHYKEVRITLKNAAGRRCEVLFRVFDDAVAFRYAVPAQPGLDHFEITDEQSAFTFAGNPQAYLLYRDKYATSHEGLYNHAPLHDLKSDKLIDLPVLLEYDDGVSVAITEAALRQYAGMYLKHMGGDRPGTLVSQLSPWPGQDLIKVKAAASLQTPWRVILIGEQPGRLIESNTVLNLNEPCALADTSWIKPGKTTWHWWNGTAGEPLDFPAALDFRTMRHYIDFCARSGIAYHAVVSTNDVHPWYVQSHQGFGPGPDTDILTPRPEIELEKLARYAREKGVGLRFWVHWKPLSEKLEAAFARYEEWGIKGLMVDFLDRDDQEMIAFAERVLQTAAKHRLHIQFHGVWKPTGLERTYPNLMNHEGVLNLEYLKWSSLCSPEHDLIVPFTRMLAGPMDYHLGGFRAVAREKFQPRNIGPSVLGTRCHQLAMYIVYQNPMPMACDYPSAYEGQPGFELIKAVPTVWDETRVLEGKPGQFLVVARRHGADWYLGAMTNWTARELPIALGFLPAGSFTADTWSDRAETKRDPNALKSDRVTVSAHDVIQAQLAPGGGFVMRLHAARAD